MLHCCSLIRGPVISGEVTVSWRIVPPSLEEFAETSGKLTMRDGQSAAIVVIQVSRLLIAVTPFAVSMRVWLGGRLNITACRCLCDIYFS